MIKSKCLICGKVIKSTGHRKYHLGKCAREAKNKQSLRWIMGCREKRKDKRRFVTIEREKRDLNIRMDHNNHKWDEDKPSELI